MPELAAPLDGTRTLRDVPLASELASLLSRAVPFPILRAMTESPVELSAGVFVAPDVLVNRLVTDLEPAFSAKPAADLLGAEISAHQGGDQVPVGIGKVTLTA